MKMIQKETFCYHWNKMLGLKQTALFISPIFFFNFSFSWWRTGTFFHFENFLEIEISCWVQLCTGAVTLVVGTRANFPVLRKHRKPKSLPPLSQTFFCCIPYLTKENDNCGTRTESINPSAHYNFQPFCTPWVSCDEFLIPKYWIFVLEKAIQ